MGLVAAGMLVFALVVVSMVRCVARLGGAARRLNRRALQARNLQSAVQELQRQAESMQRTVEEINDRAAVLRARRR
jgi:biopolymer transport protein ExbB/TolQ